MIGPLVVEFLIDIVMGSNFDNAYFGLPILHLYEVWDKWYYLIVEEILVIFDLKKKNNK